MNRDEYNFAPISTRVDYWQRYWPARVLDIMDSAKLGSKIESPRFLLESIVSDVKSLNSPNKAVWKVYEQLLSNWEKTDVFSSFKKYCALALNNWFQKPVLVSSICSQILSKMDNGELYYATIRKLSEILSIDAAISISERKHIHIYTDILIGELLSKGFVLDDIANMIYHPQIIMADTWDVIAAEDNVCGFNKQDYASVQEYETILSKYFRELSPKDKVEILNLYYEEKGKPAKVLLRLEGIKGPLQLTVNDIEFYTINCESTEKRYITNNEHYWIETPSKDQQLVNVAVPILHKSIKTTVENAVIKVNEILSMIQIWNSFQLPITLNTNKITIVISQENIIEISLPNRKEEPTPDIKYLYYSNDASRNTTALTDYSDRIAKLRRISLKEFGRLSNSAKWITSAENANTASDKLLFSWFAIESLIKLSENYKKSLISKNENGILDFVHEIIVPLVNRNHFITCKRDFIDRLYYNTKIMQNRWHVPDEVNTSLFGSDNIDFPIFFKMLPTIIESITEKSVVDDLISFVDYYNMSGNGISSFRNEVKNELTYIYRLRNYIVHDANLIDRQLPYYANRALFYASSLFNAILAISTSNGLTVEDAIIKLYSDCDIFMVEIEDMLKSYSVNIK